MSEEQAEPKPKGKGRGHNVWTRWISANKDRLPRFPPTEEGKPGKINLTAAHDIFVRETGFKPEKPYVKRGPSIYQQAEQLKRKRKKGAEPSKKA